MVPTNVGVHGGETKDASPKREYTDKNGDPGMSLGDESVSLHRYLVHHDNERTAIGSHTRS